MINKERTDQDRALDSGYSPTVLEPAYPAMTWRRRVVLSLPILAVLGAIPAAQATDALPDYPPGELPIATGDRLSAFYQYGLGLIAVIERQLPGLTPYLNVTNAAVDNLERVQDGRSAVAFTQADMVAKWRLSRAPDVVALARLYDDYLHVVVRASSPIERLADLRGRVIWLGSRGTSADVTARRLLREVGLRPVPLRESAGTPDEVRLSDERNIERANAAFHAGDIDAMFIFGGLPTAGVQHLGQLQPIRLIDLTEETVLMRQRGARYYSQLTIPRAIYGVDAIGTVGVPIYLVVRRDMDENLAYWLTRVLFEHRDILAEVYRPAERLNPRVAINTDELPLHAGAIRYYREAKGVSGRLT